MWGEELDNQLSTVNAFVYHNVSFLSDVRDFVKERAAIEREYAVRLESLAKKYTSKRDKKGVHLSVAGTGLAASSPREEVSKDESTSLTAWASVLETAVTLARRRHLFVETLINAVSDPLKTVQQKKEEARKKHIAFAAKLSGERDRIFGEALKAKAKYDECCYLVETTKQKLERMPDDKTQEKLRRQCQQEILDMNNTKNLYNLAIHVANQQQTKYHTRDIPSIMNSMQQLEEDRIQCLKEIWIEYARLESAALSDSLHQVQALTNTIDKVNGSSDSQLFVTCNKQVEKTKPEYLSFVSSPLTSDKDELCCDEDAKVFLSNKSTKTRKRLEALESQVAGKRKELDGLASLRDAYKRNPSMGDYEEIQETMMETMRHLTTLETIQTTFETEISVIVKAIGDVQPSRKQHEFKNASFTIPTSCDYCQTTIWGLSKQGNTCNTCGYSCHAKCEMKVPPNCSGIKGGAKLSRRANSMIDKERTSSTASSPKSVSPSLKFQPAVISNPTSPVGPKAVLLYDFDAAESDQLAVVAGDVVTILESDDGSGWVKAAINGSEGLLPATYIEMRPEQSFTKEWNEAVSGILESPVSAKRQVRALYNFDAAADMELTIKEGDIIDLITEDCSPGWWEGSLNGKVGQFPANYVTTDL